MLKTKVPSYYLPLAVVAGSLIAVMATGFVDRNSDAGASPTAATIPQRDCEMNFVRISGYRNIRPLVATEQRCESPKYAGIKNGISTMVEDLRRGGVVSDVSVYLRDFRRAEWTAYNGDERYQPGSLLKVPLLMTYLRMAEKDPSVMSRRLELPQKAVPPKQINFPGSASISPGHVYEVNQLLDYAITKSDNMATIPLLQNVDLSLFHHTYTDLGLADFKNDDASYPVSVKEYSMFMKALYNSSYLSIDDSELAISMLMGTEFDRGIKAGLPDSIRVAHKFGESNEGGLLQLHESALVYVGYDAYLITIMTKGRDIQALPNVLASISRYVYEEMLRLRGQGPA